MGKWNKGKMAKFVLSNPQDTTIMGKWNKGKMAKFVLPNSQESMAQERYGRCYYNKDI
jgi:hypothetical protein